MKDETATQQNGFLIKTSCFSLKILKKSTGTSTCIGHNTIIHSESRKKRETRRKMEKLRKEEWGGGRG